MLTAAVLAGAVLPLLVPAAELLHFSCLASSPRSTAGRAEERVKAKEGKSVEEELREKL